MTPQDQQQSPMQTVPSGETVRDQDKIMLILAYLGILSLIPLLTVKDSEYVKWHARQGLALFGTAIVLVVVSVIPFVGWIIVCVGQVAVLVCVVMGIVKALGGHRWKIPVVGDLATKINM